MNKLITLGSPKNYSGIASIKINQLLNLNANILYEPSIDSAFKELKDANFLVLPIENDIDDYIQRTLDLLYKYDYFITNVLELPVRFSLVSEAQKLDDIDTVYVQFKAKNQCLDFLEKLTHVHYIITDSNDESLRLLLKNSQKSAAIVPTHFVD